MESIEHDGYTYSVPALLLPSSSSRRGDDGVGGGDDVTAEDRSRCLLWTASAIRDRSGGRCGGGVDGSDGGVLLPSWPSRLSALRRRFLPISPLASERAAARCDEAWGAAWDEALGTNHRRGEDGGDGVARIGSGTSLGTDSAGGGTNNNVDDDEDGSVDEEGEADGIKIVLSEPRVLDRSGRVVADVDDLVDDCGKEDVVVAGGEDCEDSADDGAGDEEKARSAFREGILRRARYLQFEVHVHLDAIELLDDEGEGDVDSVDGGGANFSLLTDDSALAAMKIRDEDSGVGVGSDDGDGDGEGDGVDLIPDGPGWRRLTVAVRLPRQRAAPSTSPPAGGARWSHLTDPALYLSRLCRRNRRRRDPFAYMVSVLPSHDPSGYADSASAPLTRTLSRLRAEFMYDVLVREIAVDYVGPYGTLDPSLLLSTLRMDPVALEDPKPVQLRALESYHLKFGLTVKLFDAREEYPVDLPEAFLAGLDDTVADTHLLGEYNTQGGGLGGGGAVAAAAAGGAVAGEPLARSDEEAAARSNARQLDAVRDLYRRAVEAIDWIDEARTGGVVGGGSVGVGNGRAVGGGGDNDGTPTKTGGSRWWG